MDLISGATAAARVPDQLAPNRFRLTGPVEDCAHMVASVCIETGAGTGKALVAVTEHVVVRPTLIEVGVQLCARPTAAWPIVAATGSTTGVAPPDAGFNVICPVSGVSPSGVPTASSRTEMVLLSPGFTVNRLGVTEM